MSDGQPQEWVTDARGNKCSVSYWGSREAAQRALDSLIECDNCINCLRCSGCSNIANLWDKKGMKADPDSTAAPGAPPIPVIANIHATVLAAA